MIAFVCFLTIVVAVVLVENAFIGFFLCAAMLFILWQQTRQFWRLIYCILLTAIMTMAVIFMPKMTPIESLSEVTVVGYKYYTDDIIYIVDSNRETYEMYSDEHYEIGMRCYGNYEIFQGNSQRNMIKEDDSLRMVMNGINGRIYDDTSTLCEHGPLTIGMQINAFRDKYIQRILNATEHDYKFDMLTLSIGIKSYIDSELFDGLQKLGIYHLYVISGTHVAFLTGVLYYVLKRMRIPLEWIKIILIIMLLCFLLLNLFSPSVVRAVLMAVLLLITSFFRTRPYMTIISLTAIFQFLYHPNIIYNAGFQLSYITTYFILLTRHYILNRGPFVQLFMITVISEISTLLILLIHFNDLSISGILMNLIFVPLFSVVIFPSVIIFNIASLIGINGLFDYLFHFIFSNLKQVILYLSNAFQHRMFMTNLSNVAIIILLITTVTSTMAICKNKINHAIISLLIFFATIMFNQYYSSHDFKITMVDVGQGDAFLIQDMRQNKTILIDTGGRFYMDTPHIRLSDRTLLPYLKQSGINQIDMVVLSHIDLDHVGEFDHIANKVNIHYVMANMRDPAFNEFWAYDIPLVDPLENQSFEIGNINIRVLSPMDAEIQEGSNGSSIVLYIQLGKFSILFTGDAGVDEEQLLMESYQPVEADILKVGHHGSDTSSSSEFIEWLSPNIALISAGVDNRYGHPHDSVLDTLSGMLILSTNEVGMVEMVIDGDTLCVTSKLGNDTQCMIKK